jgi:RNA polymerase sigma-70 factor (ECF subfamily)
VGCYTGRVDSAADSFEPHRRHLAAVAYRMLGSVAEAEDVVQDAYLRWAEVDRAAVEVPRAYLARTVARLCLDRMKSARAQREEYVGTWLPEPLIAAADPGDAGDVSVALMVTLERLSPLERAAFLLHDVFEMDFAEIGEALERTEAACRQLAARARDHVREGRARFTATPETTARLAAAFHGAILRGDLAALSTLLAEDATFYSDAGGKRRAALNPIHGRERILRFLVGIATKFGATPTAEGLRAVTINGDPGFIVDGPEGRETLAFACDGESIAAIYSIRNPDKLRHLG